MESKARNPTACDNDDDDDDDGPLLVPMYSKPVDYDGSELLDNEIPEIPESPTKEDIQEEKEEIVEVEETMVEEDTSEELSSDEEKIIILTECKVTKKAKNPARVEIHRIEYISVPATSETGTYCFLNVIEADNTDVIESLVEKQKEYWSKSPKPSLNELLDNIRVPFIRINYELPLTSNEFKIKRDKMCLVKFLNSPNLIEVSSNVIHPSFERYSKLYEYAEGLAKRVEVIATGFPPYLEIVKRKLRGIKPKRKKRNKFDYRKCNFCHKHCGRKCPDASAIKESGSSMEKARDEHSSTDFEDDAKKTKERETCKILNDSKERSRSENEKKLIGKGCEDDTLLEQARLDEAAINAEVRNNNVEEHALLIQKELATENKINNLCGSSRLQESIEEHNEETNEPTAASTQHNIDNNKILIAKEKELIQETKRSKEKQEETNESTENTPQHNEEERNTGIVEGTQSSKIKPFLEVQEETVASPQPSKEEKVLIVEGTEKREDTKEPVTDTIIAEDAVDETIGEMHAESDKIDNTKSLGIKRKCENNVEKSKVPRLLGEMCNEEI